MTIAVLTLAWVRWHRMRREEECMNELVNVFLKRYAEDGDQLGGVEASLNSMLHKDSASLAKIFRSGR